MTEWDKLWEGLRAKSAYSRIGQGVGKNWLNQVKAEGDKLQKEKAICEGICKGLLEDRVNAWNKLEAIRTIVSIPDVWTHPDPTKAIREVLGDE